MQIISFSQAEVLRYAQPIVVKANGKAVQQQVLYNPTLYPQLEQVIRDREEAAKGLVKRSGGGRFIRDHLSGYQLLLSKGVPTGTQGIYLWVEPNYNKGVHQVVVCVVNQDGSLTVRNRPGTG